MILAAASFLFTEVQFSSAPVGEFSAANNAATKQPSQPPVGIPGGEDSNSADGNATVALRSPDTGQEATTESTLAGGETALIRWSPDTGIPAFITGPIAPPATGSPVSEALSFFAANKDLFQMNDPGAELVSSRETTDETGMVHVQMAQYFHGVPVFGSQMSVHFSSGNMIQTVNGNYVPGIDISVEPDVPVEAAAATALGDFGSTVSISTFEPPQLVVLCAAGAQPSLTWKITLVNDDPPVRTVYFIDAHHGGVTSRYDALESARNRHTHTAGSGTSIPGTLLISEGGSSGDAVAQAAHNNTGATYDYYYSTFGRDSFNNAGATLVSTVHYDVNYNNAFWNGYQMVYGDGDGSYFSPLGSGLDVVAHELTHGVTQYTAGLVYSYQSGALNESYSDVLGEMVENRSEGSTDWLMGEDVYTPQTPGDALRSLSNPQQYGQPANMSSYVNTSSDNGGVHTNSGIPNKAAYNIATAIGSNKMERIWYRTLTLYLNSGSQFSDARDASVQAATDLYGSNSPEVTAVKNGFSAVGIGGTPTSAQTARIEIDHTYRGDLVVVLGVGNPDSPTWSTLVSNRVGGSASNIYTTVDITSANAYLPPGGQNRWYLKVYDGAARDSGSIQKFAITNNGTTYTATDTPVTINDFQTVYSYIPAENTIPVESPFLEKWNSLNGAPGAATDVYQETTGGSYQNFTDGRLYENSAASAVYWVHGAILPKYDSLGKETSYLGMPTSDEYAVPGGRAQNFTGGTIYWSPATWSHEVHGNILIKYLAMNGPQSFGLPTTDVTSISAPGATGALETVFQGGRIYTSDSNVTREVHGAILSKYLSFGGPQAIGLPTSDETVVPGATAARMSTFSGAAASTIYWTPWMGAHLLYGNILEKYQTLDVAVFGLPVHDIYDVPGVAGAQECELEGGRIYYSSGTGAHEVHGAILAKYLTSGGPAWFGLPTSDEQDPGISGVFARFNSFQYANVYWSPETSAHVVYNQIMAGYTPAGGPSGVLGLPVTDTTPIYAAGATGALRSTFQGGHVYAADGTGAHEVHGAILAKYLVAGGPAWFGVPIENEQDAGAPAHDLSRYSKFQFANFYWSAATGSHEVHGAILAAYLAAGGANGSGLGLPTSDEFYAGGSTYRNNFENGHYIWWTPTTGAQIN